MVLYNLYKYRQIDNDRQMDKYIGRFLNRQGTCINGQIDEQIDLLAFLVRQMYRNTYIQTNTYTYRAEYILNTLGFDGQIYCIGKIYI